MRIDITLPGSNNININTKHKRRSNVQVKQKAAQAGV